MWKKFLHYLDIRTLFAKPKEGELKPNFSLRAMHGINRISIFMFLICLVVLFFRYVVNR
ncbi:MAG: hypothetical protein M0D57_01540 [Sphingobacteriales bacterium JAD_PAG50586_3]|nr:MAG: hypothetical protein M0D57_01540 [Sphingobacteriales bacterium JAD_PAG50586_3]